MDGNLALKNFILQLPRLIFRQDGKNSIMTKKQFQKKGEFTD